jgi:glutaredoxin
MTALIYVHPGCDFCTQLENRLTNAGIPFTTTEDNSACGFGKTPGTYLNGTCYGYDTYDINAQYDAIAADYNAPTTPAAPSVNPAPAAEAPAATTPAAAAAPAASEELIIKWGGVSGTAAKTYEELLLEATNPTPPDAPVGLTVALRNQKKAPIGRKVA